MLYSYQNQKECAAGLKRAFKEIPGLKREDLFIVSPINCLYLKELSTDCCNRHPSCGTSKFSNTQLSIRNLTPISQHRPEIVEASLDACLAELELDYLDVCLFAPSAERRTDVTQLYLVHWPVAFAKGDVYFPLKEGSNVEGGDVIIDDGVSIVDTWKGMFCDYNCNDHS